MAQKLKWKVDSQSQINKTLAQFIQMELTIGNGLYLKTNSTGSGNWIFKKTIKGKKVRENFGKAEDIPLQLAKKSTETLIKKIKSLTENDSEVVLGNHKIRSTTYFDVYREYIEMKSNEWKVREGKKKSKSLIRWEGIHRDYILPKIGNMNPQNLTQDDFLEILKPLWETKNETAIKTKQCLKQVLTYAKAKKIIDIDLQILTDREYSLILLGEKKEPESFASLHFSEVNDFWIATNKNELSFSNLALQFLILTGFRTMEVAQMKWKWLRTRIIDHDTNEEATFIELPKHISKTEESYLVPCTSEIKKILQQAICLRKKHKKLKQNSEYIFLSPYSNNLGRQEFLSENAILLRINKMHKNKLKLDNVGWIDQYQERKITGHGFRSTFRTFGGEKTNYDERFLEACINHSKDGISSVYDRGNMLVQKVDLFKKWTEYVTKKTVNTDSFEIKDLTP